MGAMTNDLPPSPAIIRFDAKANTNRYHLTFTWDVVPGATWYYIKVKTNGVEAFRRYSMTNTVTVSNLTADLSRYSFVAVATNVIGESDETPEAPKKLVILQDGTNVLRLEPRVPSVYFTNLHPMSIKQWNGQQELKKD
jgi:hypothetical protein